MKAVSRFSIRGRLSSRRAFSSSPFVRAKSVRIVEVGPRDGLQNEKTSIPLATKIELVRRLAATGLQTIEAGSFVHPKWVPQVGQCHQENCLPDILLSKTRATLSTLLFRFHGFRDIDNRQMANSSAILESMLQTPPASLKPVKYQWLLPNVKGLENFFAVHSSSSSRHPSPADEGGPAPNTSSDSPDTEPPAATYPDGSYNKSDGASTTSSVDNHEVSIFMAATESFSQKNINCSIAESLQRFEPLIALARKRQTPVRAYISVALGCPYEGLDVSPQKVAELATTLLEMGASEISVADTTGMGTAPRTSELLRALTAAGIRNEDLAFHFHDTYGQALVNTVVALEHGIRTFDSAVGGLGGCPYSPGATGNVATEDLVHCLHGLGADTGVDLVKVSEIGEWISHELGRPNESRAGKATLSRLK